MQAHKELPPLTVSQLNNIKFSMLAVTEKLVIRSRGRPTPEIEINDMFNKKQFKSAYINEWYKRKSWLCGCEVKKALFCFPCLLFEGEYRWTKEGFTRISKLKETADQHEVSRKHVDNELSLALLGITNNKGKQNAVSKLSVQEHNKNVAKNRLILSKIIDFLLLCGTSEVTFYGCQDADDSSSFKKLVNFASKLDPELRYDLKNNKAFENLFLKTFQNEIFDSLFQVYQNEVKKEIEEAPYAAVIYEDVTNICEYTQVFIVFRYVFKGEIFERFWGCFTTEHQSVDQIANCILEQLNVALQGDKQKLIAQSFDGPCFMNNKKLNVLMKIKEIYRNAHVTHCYAHQLNEMMKNIASVTTSSKLFFSNIAVLSNFFSKSPQCQTALQKGIKSKISWNFYVKAVCGVYENLNSVRCCLEEIQRTSNTDSFVSNSVGINKCLNDEQFLFWLEIFYLIVPHIEILYNHMQLGESEPRKVCEYLENFEACVLAIKNSKYCENASLSLTNDAKEFFDFLCANMRERYSYTVHLVIAYLLNKDKYIIHNKLFPLTEMELIEKAYPYLKTNKLFNELKVFYDRTDLHVYSKLHDLLNFFTESNLIYIFSETISLIHILLTLPMATKEQGRYFSSLKGIKSFLRNAESEDCLNALTMISAEHDFFETHSYLKEKAIDLFAQSKQEGDFSFKSVESSSDKGTSYCRIKRNRDSPVPVEDKRPAWKRIRQTVNLVSETSPTANSKPIPKLLTVVSGSGPHILLVPDLPEDLSDSQQCMSVEIKKEPDESEDTFSFPDDGDSNSLPASSRHEGSLYQPISIVKEEPITIEEEPTMSVEKQCWKSQNHNEK